MARSQVSANWAGGNLLLLAALYVGLWHDIYWIGLTAAAFIWVMLAAYAAVYFSDGKAKNYKKSPMLLGLAVDALALYALVIHAWYATWFAYLASMVLLHLIERRSNNALKESPSYLP